MSGTRGGEETKDVVMEICCRSRWENGGSRGKSQEHATTPTQINYVDVGGSELRWCREVAGGEVGWAYTESSQPRLDRPRYDWLQTAPLW